MQTSCTQCGECCRKGGPALHIEDKFLIMQGKLPANHLFTLRKGEIGMDPVENKKIRLEEEIIKIQPDKQRDWACTHLSAEGDACEIYTSRPVECRLLKCWDTRALLARYREDRLTRKDIFGGMEGLWDLIEDHEKRCSYEKIRDLVDQLEKNGGKDAESTRKLGDILLYDKHIREVMQEKKPEMATMADLLLGRPLMQTMPAMFDLKIEKKDSGWVIKPRRIPV
ncbi:YkgJ family cysteine cluster protein [Desulfobotulus sp. H1]|uniref:YkgJ family cysteine cluster protein n=1 Tax=Desulfobotulus pelophilus TaxID=2823377 RepID=A0ABT3ND40_9BACT|nr:YkgJ family cysteine cluster protein [Desulfobotulus pelophilus]MCW7755374.1 YkgJ family cysteine cluster protein [Desulfobotulus pelophilus]